MYVVNQIQDFPRVQGTIYDVTPHTNIDVSRIHTLVASELRLNNSLQAKNINWLSQIASHN